MPTFDFPVIPWGGADSRGLALLACLLSILCAGACLVSLARKFAPDVIDAPTLISMGLTGGLAGLIALALPVFAFAAWRGDAADFQTVFLALTVGLGLGAVLLNLRPHRPLPGSRAILLMLAALFAGLLLLRLAFLRDLAMPPYSDPVEHYQIVSDLLHPERPPQAFYHLGRITARYYHFGFHALAGWVSALPAAPVQETLMVLGQALQAVIPLALFFPVRAAARSDAAGLWTALLAGLAWRMPAYASNWGKYPALTGLAVLPFAFGMLILAQRAEDRQEKRIWLVFGLAGGILSALSHTRMLLYLAMAAGGWWLAGRLLAARRAWQIGAAGAATLLAAGLGWVASADPGLAFLLAPYFREGFFITCLSALLIPAGFKLAPRPMLAALLFLFFLLCGAWIPLPQALARFGYQTLLDRPFAQMTLFLPLSVIGGIGLAGLGSLAQAGPARALWRAAALLLPLALVVYAFRQYGVSASPCCRIASADDVLAYRWIEANLPPDSVILIAANRTPSRFFGVDGGIWITPLTGYRTEKWPHNTDLGSAAALEQICAKGATHIYAGGTSARFSVETLERRPDWYENLLTRPGAYLYRITGCAGPAD